jgi:hypothetical protein
MNGQFSIIEKSETTRFEYTNESLTVNGSYSKNGQTGELRDVNGTAYKTVEGNQTYVGNFNGVKQDGEMLYSMSQMKRQDSLAVWGAIDEIEAAAIGGVE